MKTYDVKSTKWFGDNKIKMLFVFTMILSLVLVTASINVAVADAGSNTVVGAWYSTWYAKTLSQSWITGHGYGSSNQLMGDVNGDGKDDAIAYFTSSGSWYTALSSGTKFNNYSSWITSFGIGSTKQFLVDVNGDGKADAVTYFASTGSWYVALSNGTGFGTPTLWISGHGVGSTNQFLGDVNGDSKADAVTYSASTGSWYVALSNGTSFGTSSLWISGHGASSTNQLVGDVNGDGKADAVAYFASTGSWNVALSNGTSYDTPSLWISGHGVGSTSQLLGDMNGDGKADAVVYFAGSGSWYAATANSNGTGFNSYYMIWSGYAVNSNKQFIANPYGQSNKQCTAFFSTGEWQSRCDKFNEYNTWEAWNIKYLPYSLESYQTYDSGNTAVIDEHLQMLADAKIDFILMDETNNLYVDDSYIFNRAEAVAARIKVWNSNPANRPIKYAIAIGGIQFNNNPQTLEYETGEVWNQFVNTQNGGTSNYYYFNGKPLIVTYCSQTNEDTWTAWNGDKTNSNQFTCRWAHSPSTSGTYGWELPSTGSISNDEIMVVMPGWNNNKGAPTISRNNSNYYSNLCWNNVINRTPKPSIVIINSFNEYAEETAVAPTDTSNVSAPTEKWYNTNGVVDNYLYWNLTKSYINLLKGGTVDYIEVTGVTLNQSDTSLIVGQTEALSATITKSNASNQQVNWTTSNPYVATVENGVVTAVSEGSAVITVTTLDGGYTASCQITVNPMATFGDYQHANQMITNVQPKTTVNSCLEGLHPASGVDVVFKNSAGNEITDNDYVGTGTTIEMTAYGKKDTYTLIIYGDVNGDGKIDLNDLCSCRDSLLDKQKLDGIYKSAGDLYKENNITLNDLVGIMSYICNNSNINQMF